MFNLHQEIATPVGIVIIISCALIAVAVIIWQDMELIKATYSVGDRLLLEDN